MRLTVRPINAGIQKMLVCVQAAVLQSASWSWTSHKDARTGNIADEVGSGFAPFLPEQDVAPAWETPGLLYLTPWFCTPCVSNLGNLSHGSATFLGEFLPDRLLGN